VRSSRGLAGCERECRDYRITRRASLPSGKGDAYPTLLPKKNSCQVLLEKCLRGRSKPRRLLEALGSMACGESRQKCWGKPSWVSENPSSRICGKVNNTSTHERQEKVLPKVVRKKFYQKSAGRRREKALLTRFCLKGEYRRAGSFQAFLHGMLFRLDQCGGRGDRRPRYPPAACAPR
jgi:hypothetical protein